MGKGTRPVKSARRRNLPCHIAKYNYVAIWIYLSERTPFFVCLSVCFFVVVVSLALAGVWLVFKGLLALAFFVLHHK